jgi:hypothetical protein
MQARKEWHGELAGGAAYFEKSGEDWAILQRFGERAFLSAGIG